VLEHPSPEDLPREEGDRVTDVETRAAILAEKHRRLRLAAEAVVEGTRPAGGDRPLCAVEPALIRTLRRELQHRPQPQPLDWMSVT
jgi:hypothetical protein